MERDFSPMKNEIQKKKKTNYTKSYSQIKNAFQVPAPFTTPIDLVCVGTTHCVPKYEKRNKNCVVSSERSLWILLFSLGFRWKRQTRNTFITYCAAHPWCCGWSAVVHCSRNSREFLFGRSFQWWMNMIFCERKKEKNQFRNGLVPFVSICRILHSIVGIATEPICRPVGSREILPFPRFDGIWMFYEWNSIFCHLQRFHTNQAHFFSFVQPFVTHRLRMYFMNLLLVQWHWHNGGWTERRRMNGRINGDVERTAFGIYKCWSCEYVWACADAES